MEIIDVITSKLVLIFPEISRKFLDILNFRKIYNLTAFILFIRLFSHLEQAHQWW